MGSRIECFLLERTDLARVYWRRWPVFVGTTKDCTMGGDFHRARVMVTDSIPFDSVWEGEGRYATAEELADPRFPRVCTACGKPFGPDEDWPRGINGGIAYRDLERLYRTPDGALVTTREAPAGALWLWKPPNGSHLVGPDGLQLHVMLPDNTDWCPDYPAVNSGTPWQRTGVPPRLTATPSILTARYHGFLTNGFLVEC